MSLDNETAHSRHVRYLCDTIGRAVKQASDSGSRGAKFDRASILHLARAIMSLNEARAATS